MTKIAEVLDISTSPTETREIRIVDIDGVRHLQMQGKRHDAMMYTWADGVVMTCPADIALLDVSHDPERYYRGYGDGCEMLDEVPRALWD